MSDSKVVYYEFVKDNKGKTLPICKIVLNSSNGVHSLTPELISGLQSILKELESNDKCAGYILTANTARRRSKNKRPIFCSGLDLKTLNCGNTMKIAKYLFSISATWTLIHQLKKPIIGCISGDAIAGGCQFAFNLDYRITYKCIKFSMPETAIGLPIQESVTASMNRVIGSQHRTAWFLQTGLPLSGDKAKEFNIVDRFVEDGNEEALINAGIDVLMNEYFYTKGIKLNKKIKCASTARINGRQEIISISKDQLSGKKKFSGGSYVGLKGMTNKNKKSKL
eukprot:249743_1